MTQVQLTIVLILTLVFGAAQCVASCAAISCHDANVPPCHKQHQTIDHRSCGLDFLRPDTGLTLRDSPSTATPVSHIALDSDKQLYDTEQMLVSAPPGARPSSVVVLRI